MKSNHRGIHIVPEGNGYAAALIALLFVEALFLFILMAMNVLPAKYEALIVLVLAAVDFAVAVLLAGRGSDRLIKNTGLVLLLVIIYTRDLVKQTLGQDRPSASCWAAAG